MVERESEVEIRIEQMVVRSNGGDPQRLRILGVEVEAAGATADDLCERVASALTSVLRSPSVQVTIRHDGFADATASCAERGEPAPEGPGPVVAALTGRLDGDPPVDAALFDRAVEIALAREAALQSLTERHPVLVDRAGALEELLELLDRTPAGADDAARVHASLRERKRESDARILGAGIVADTCPSSRAARPRRADHALACAPERSRERERQRGCAEEESSQRGTQAPPSRKMGSASVIGSDVPSSASVRRGCGASAKCTASGKGSAGAWCSPGPSTVAEAIAVAPQP